MEGAVLGHAGKSSVGKATAQIWDIANPASEEWQIYLYKAAVGLLVG